MDVVSGHELEPSRATNGLDLRQKLHESEERFRLIVENAREYAIFTMDLSRMVTSWNSGAERLMGYREAEIIDVFPAAIVAEHAHSDVVRSNRGNEREYAQFPSTDHW